MTATLTLNLDSEVLKWAEQEALSHHTTLPEVLGRQLRVMAGNWRDSQQGKTPVNRRPARGGKGAGPAGKVREPHA